MSSSQEISSKSKSERPTVGGEHDVLSDEGPMAPTHRPWSPPIVYRLAFSFIMLIAISMGLLGYVNVSYQNELMLRQTNEYGSTIAAQYAYGATDLVFTEDFFALQVLTSHLVNDERILGAAVYNHENLAIAKAGDVPPRLEKEIARLRDEPFLRWQRLTFEGEEELISFVAPVTFRGVSAGHALVTFSFEGIRQGFKQSMRTVLLVTALMIFIAFLFAFYISRRLAKPIKQLVGLTQKIAQGNFKVAMHERRGDEIGMLVSAVNRMARSLGEKQQVEGLLSRVVADDVAKKMLSDLESSGVSSERVDASVLFVDIVSFTPMTEVLDPEAVVDLLNEYFAYFNCCARLFHGSIDKFIGDCAMVIFGAPRVNHDHRFNAVACALVIQQLVGKLNENRKRRGLNEVRVRIGVNSGEMMAGTVGAAQRLEYTVVGDAVNIASRICSLAEPDGIVIGEGTYRGHDIPGRVQVEALEPMPVKGKSKKFWCYKLLGIKKSHQNIIDSMIRDILEHKEEIENRKSDKVIK